MVRAVVAICTMAMLIACSTLAQDQTDPLERHVTVLLKGVTLRELADEVTSQTGVTYKISKSLADERLTVMARDKPLRELHRLIADLYHVHVSRSDTSAGEVRFEVWSDAKRRELDSNLVKQAWSDIAAAFLEDAGNGQSELKPSEAYVELLLQMVAELDQQQMYRIVEGRTATIPYEMLTKSQKDRLFRVYELLEGRLARSQQEDEAEGYIPVKRDAVASEDIERFGLRLRVTMELLSGRCTLMPSFVEKFSTSHVALCDVWLRDSAYLPVRGCPYTRNDEEELASITLPVTESPIVIPADATWEDLLEAIHKATGLTVVSDHYMASDGYFVQKDGMPGRFDPAKEKLPECLDKACKGSDHLWWEVEGSCLFRTQLWYVRSLYEVPKEQLGRWQKTLETKGRLGSADIDQLAQLTARQVEGLSALCGQGAGWRADGFYEALSFYKGLTGVQKDASLKNGVSGESLGPEKEAVLRQMAEDRIYTSWKRQVIAPRLILIQGGESPFYYPSLGAPEMKKGKVHELAFWVKLDDKRGRNTQIGSIYIPYGMDEKRN